MRISGLVRVARTAEARLRAGVPPQDRDGFLATVRRHLAEVHGLLVHHGARPEDLPKPSRTALASLQRISALSPREIPEPAPERGHARPVRVRNVVRSLQVCEDLLARGAASAERVQEARDLAEVASDGIRQACERADSSPAGLPLRSRNAYAMLRWLAEEDHAALYAAQVDEALRGLTAGLPEAERASHAAVRVAFAAGRLLYKAARRPDGIAWRLSTGFLAAGGEEFQDLATVARFRKRTPRAIRERHDAFARSEAFTRVPLELEWLADPQPFRAQGRAYDLDRFYEALDRSLLRGRIERPHLHWWTTLSRRTFGFHLPSRDLVCVNTVLDDPAVPEHVAEFVLYHECLHKLHAPRIGGGRRIVHTRAFRAAERQHPRHAEAEGWLDRLAR